jgi:phosphate transport system protein
MPRHFQAELEKIKKKLLAIGALVEISLNKAVRSVQERSETLAREVMDKDKEIDLAEVDLEEDCLKILALYQPVAIDLRFIVSALKMNNDLERIGDLTGNIAGQGLYLSKEAPLEAPFDLPGMAEKTKGMLKKALDAFIQMDNIQAQQVLKEDDKVDAINRQMYETVLPQIKKMPDRTEALIHFLSVSRNLERIADYATNIAEDVIYMIEGRIIRHGGAK